MAEKLERFGVALRVRVPVDAHSAEVVGDSDDVEFIGNVDGVDVGAVGYLRPHAHRLERESAARLGKQKTI